MSSHTDRKIADRYTIRELTPELLGTYLDFFDNTAFADNPEWAKCYCRCYYYKHDLGNWEATTAAENRGAVCDLIKSRQMRGYLALDDGRPVAWCNAAPRTHLPPIEQEQPMADANQVGSIVCFVVAKDYRGKGIARRLLQAACDGFVRQGFKLAEAYPSRNATTDARNYHGPLSMYLEAGFEIVDEEADGGVLVRKRLA
jgi:GNAT superfamily N-acetyltransferase